MTSTLPENSIGTTDSIKAEAIEDDRVLSAVEDSLNTVSVIDVHTHLFKPSLSKVGAWGIDDLVTYHYLEAELFRSSCITPDEYWKLSKQQKADAIWQALFVENSPISEATRGVVAVLQAFGLPTGGGSLRDAREFFAAQDLEAHIQKVFELAGVGEVIMTNDPLDPEEGPLWESGAGNHPQFHAVLRLDRVLNKWTEHWRILAQKGYGVDQALSGRSIAEVRRFLDDWCARMSPVYMAVSLPDTFTFPEDSVRGKLLAEAVLPACREFDIALSLMIGVRYRVNPALRLAGDAAGRADLHSLENLCRDYPNNRFLTSVLSRENQYELCVYARKFANLMPFGCWWFLNNPSIVEEITRERIEMLGTSFIAQHSDARILEQVIYKWRNTRRTMAAILANSYRLMAADGYAVTRQTIDRDVNRLFRSNVEKWTKLRAR
ncbi:MAG: glucuronate isomerase [Acidobacteriota bacterium]|nr:glucuronate isomerase [Acidobacteriota bacterium]